MDWSSVGIDDLAIALQQVEYYHAPRPASEFFSKFTVPKNQNKLLGRIKCNLYYYRTNYVFLFLGSASLMFVRNPFGALSLGIMAIGVLTLNDSITIALSDQVMSFIRRAHPAMANKIRSRPGGHNGLAVPPGRKPSLKIAGQPRNHVALAMLGLGSCAVFLSSALVTLTMGAALGSTLVLLHASFRSPNLKARLSQARSRLDTMGGNFARDYGL